MFSKTKKMCFLCVWFFFVREYVYEKLMPILFIFQMFIYVFFLYLLMMFLFALWVFGEFSQGVSNYFGRFFDWEIDFFWQEILLLVVIFIFVSKEICFQKFYIIICIVKWKLRLVTRIAFKFSNLICPVCCQVHI